MKTFISCLIATAMAAEGDFNYSQQGKDWSSINALCGNGTKQSPIDIPAKGSDSLASQKFLKIRGEGYANYSAQEAGYSDHTIKITAAAGDYYYTNEEDNTFPFRLSQFHMHAPSEHTHDGNHYDLEMHFVHTINGGENYAGVADYAVIGLFFDRSAGNTDNAFLTSLAASSTRADNTSVNISDVNVADFLGGLDLADGYYTYNGSFTTPPCTEGVKWVVVNQIQPISDAQLT